MSFSTPRVLHGAGSPAVALAGLDGLVAVGEHFEEVALGTAEVDPAAGAIAPDGGRFARGRPVLDTGGDETVDDARRSGVRRRSLTPVDRLSRTT